MNPHHPMMNMPPMMNPVSPMGMGGGHGSMPPMSPIGVVPSPQPFRSHQTPGPPMQEPQGPDSLLHVSWHNSQWPPNALSAQNVLDYFSNSSNPFYERGCNNEVLKMQRMSIDQLINMKGTEYVVFHALEPLFVIRKQVRHSPNQISPLADYYIIGGTAYQAPDLCSVINSRVLSAMDHLRTAFEEAVNYRKYSAAKGYYWEFKGKQRKPANPAKEAKQQEQKQKEQEQAAAIAEQQQRSTTFQRSRVDALLGKLTEKFPPPSQANPGGTGGADGGNAGPVPNQIEQNSESMAQGGGGGGVTRTAAQANLDTEAPLSKRVKLEMS